MPPEYVIVQTGVLADGSGTLAYQVFERSGDWAVLYYTPVRGCPNDPTTLSKARARLATLLRGEENA